MTDRERILTHLIQTMLIHKNEFERTFFQKQPFTVGNILIAQTNFRPHKWTISIYDHYDKENDCYVVKDIVTGKLCNYYNESFTEIKKEWLSEYELLTGKKYKIYSYCVKYGTDYLRFHSLVFDEKNNTFSFKTRLPFHKEPSNEITLSMDLSLKEIRKELEYGNSWVELKKEKQDDEIEADE